MNVANCLEVVRAVVDCIDARDWNSKGVGGEGGVQSFEIIYGPWGKLRHGTGHRILDVGQRFRGLLGVRTNQIIPVQDVFGASATTLSCPHCSKSQNHVYLYPEITSTAA